LLSVKDDGNISITGRFLLLRFQLAFNLELTKILLELSSFLFDHIFRWQAYQAHVVGSEELVFQPAYELRTIQLILILVLFRIEQNSEHHHNHFHF